MGVLRCLGETDPGSSPSVLGQPDFSVCGRHLYKGQFWSAWQRSASLVWQSVEGDQVPPEIGV